MRAAGLFFLLCATAVDAAERLSGEIRLGNSVTAPAAYEQRWVAVASSGDEMLAVWIDQRMGQQPFAPPVLFATRISSSGEILDLYGVRLSSQPAHEPPVVAWGGDAYLARRQRRLERDLLAADRKEWPAAARAGAHHRQRPVR